MIKYENLSESTKKLFAYIIRKKHVSRDSVLKVYEEFVNDLIRQVKSKDHFPPGVFESTCASYTKSYFGINIFGELINLFWRVKND